LLTTTQFEYINSKNSGLNSMFNRPSGFPDAHVRIDGFTQDTGGVSHMGNETELTGAEILEFARIRSPVGTAANAVPPPPNANMTAPVPAAADIAEVARNQPSVERGFKNSEAAPSSYSAPQTPGADTEADTMYGDGNGARTNDSAISVSTQPQEELPSELGRRSKRGGERGEERVKPNTKPGIELEKRNGQYHVVRHHTGGK
jgi:hypothetical protein